MARVYLVDGESFLVVHIANLIETVGHRSESVRDRYWTPLTDNDSPDKYAAEVDKFFRVILRCQTGHPSEYKMPLTSVQSSYVSRLIQTLKGGGESSKMIGRFHDLSVSLLAPQAEDSDSHTWTSPIRCFLALRAVREDGNFVQADTLTGWLAKWKYFCVNCALLHATKLKINQGSSMIQLVSRPSS